MDDDENVINLSEFIKEDIPVEFSMSYPAFTVNQDLQMESEIVLLKKTVATLQKQVYDGYKRIIELNEEISKLKNKTEE